MVWIVWIILVLSYNCLSCRGCPYYWEDYAEISKNLGVSGFECIFVWHSRYVVTWGVTIT